MGNKQLEIKLNLFKEKLESAKKSGRQSLINVFASKVEAIEKELDIFNNDIVVENKNNLVNENEVVGGDNTNHIPEIFEENFTEEEDEDFDKMYSIDLKESKEIYSKEEDIQLVDIKTEDDKKKKIFKFF